MNSEVTNARWLRWSLSAIAALLAVIAVELSALTGPLQPRAMAQIPDSGMQRKQLLDAQGQTNALLEQILDQLRTGPIKVKVVSTDKDSKVETREAPRPPRK
jgi:hypothetical protein